MPGANGNISIWEHAEANNIAGIRYLVTDGEVDPNERDSSGRTALHIAASRGYSDVCSCLWQLGADLNLKDEESGWTALHHALYNHHLKVTLLLIRLGAALDQESRSSPNNDKSARSDCHRGRKSDGSFSDVRDREGLSPLDLVSILLRPWLLHAHKYREGGEVYTFGKVDYQLGYFLPNTDIQHIPRRVDAISHIGIVCVSAGKYHTMAVSKNGRVFCWGFGRGGRLGVGNELNHLEPSLVQTLANKTIVGVAAGENHSMAYSAEGELYCWGSDKLGQLGQASSVGNLRLTPRRVDSLKKFRVIGIAAGATHSAAVTADGAVFAWGSNKSGQLGFKDGLGTNHAFPSPKKVDNLYSHHMMAHYGSLRRAVDVAAGAFNTCVILAGDMFDSSMNFGNSGATSLAGDVWHWGHGSPFPTKLSVRKGERNTSNKWRMRKTDTTEFVKVACSKHHSIALSSDGSVYTWGAGSDVLGLGSGNESHTGVPQLLKSLRRHGSAISIAAAINHCAVIMDSGDLFTWGSGDRGTLGHGQKTWQPMPKKVTNVKRAVSVAVACDHTVVLLAPSKPPLPDVPKDEPLSPWQLFTSRDNHPPRAEELMSKDQTDSTAQADQLDMESDDEEVEEMQPTEEGWNPQGYVPSLKLQATRAIARAVDVRNVSMTLAYADAYNAPDLVEYCVTFIQRNLDAVLTMTKPKDRELLEELSVEIQQLKSGISSDTSNVSAFEEVVLVASKTEETNSLEMAFQDTIRRLKSNRKKLRQIQTLQEQWKDCSKFTAQQQRKLDSLQNILGTMKTLESTLKEQIAEPELRNSKNRKGALELLSQLVAPHTPVSSAKKHRKEHFSAENRISAEKKAGAMNKSIRRSFDFAVAAPASSQSNRSEVTGPSAAKSFAEYPPLSPAVGTPHFGPNAQSPSPQYPSTAVTPKCLSSTATSASQPLMTALALTPSASPHEQTTKNRRSSQGLRGLIEMQQLKARPVPFSRIEMSQVSPDAQANSPQLDLGALIDAQQKKNVQPSILPAWSSKKAAKVESPIISSKTLLDIQAEQLSEASQTTSHSSWGLCERRAISLTNVLRQQQEDSDYALALQFAEEEERLYAAMNSPGEPSPGEPNRIAVNSSRRKQVRRSKAAAENRRVDLAANQTSPEIDNIVTSSAKRSLTAQEVSKGNRPRRNVTGQANSRSDGTPNCRSTNKKKYFDDREMKSDADHNDRTVVSAEGSRDLGGPAAKHKMVKRLGSNGSKDKSNRWAKKEPGAAQPVATSAPLHA